MRATTATAPCPRCGRTVPAYMDGRLATHRIDFGPKPRPNCKASGRRSENALIEGDLRGRADLRRGGTDVDHG